MSGTGPINSGNMETDKKFLAMVTELIESSHSRPSCTSPAEGNMELDCSRVIEKFLPSPSHDISIRAPNFIECLRGCFNNPNRLLMEFMLETNKRRKVSKNNWALELRDNNLQNNNLHGSFLVNVTAVSNPGKFYVLPNYQIEAMNINCINPLQRLAPNSSFPVEILPDQMYAVLNSAGKWSRAFIGPPSGNFQVGDEPVETLYECFLLDFGTLERISQKDIRVLPEQFLGLPPFALECTLNVNFEPKIWSVTSTIIFKRWTSQGSMKMQVIAQRKGVLSVDLLDSLGDGNYVSVRDCLMHLEEPPSFAAPKLFKPKYTEEELEINPPKEAAVIITNSSQPSEMYIQIVNEELALYNKMKKELQLEFSSTTVSVPPAVGYPYAVLNGNEWSRVLIEMWRSDKVAFHVDTGLRQHIYPNMKFHKLPDSYLEIPAQAIRCSLHGVFPVSNMGGSLRNDVESFPIDLHLFMAQFEAKPAVAIFVDWQAGEVGFSEGSSFQELTANVVLYPDGDANSINVQVGQTPMALLGDEQIEFPDHFKIRRELQQHLNRINSNVEPKSPIPDASPKVSMASVIEKPINKVTKIQLDSSSSVKTSCAPVSAPPAGSSATKPVPSPSTSVRPSTAKTGSEINHNQPSKLVIKKFKTKFSSLELRSSPLKYAAVTITQVTQPRSIYIRIEDDDVPRYFQLLRELDLEFRSATIKSSSYCSSPIIGQSYAIQNGSRWQRCLIESSRDRQLMVFYVDTGRRDLIRPYMLFHELPERFLELPAQAIRCSLYGVDPPKNPDGSRGWKFPREAFSFLLRFNGKPAVAFFNHWKTGQVGRCSSIPEFEAFTVIYPKDELSSINKQICLSPRTAVLVDEFIEHPGHFQIQCNLAAPKSIGSSEMTPSVAIIRASSSPDVPLKRAPPNSQKFRPKFSHHQLNSNPLRYANGTIMKATSPKLIYIRVEDLDVPRYHRMQEELHLEFRTDATVNSSTPPVVGNAYAAQLGNHWYRALIDSYNGCTTVFFVDVGHRLPFSSSMMIHNLPARFMELPAQAVRCRLQGVFPPRNPDGSFGSAFPQSALDFMHQLDSKKVAAYFHEWNAGQVGYFANPALRELQACVMLYLSGEKEIVNDQIAKGSIMARLLDKPSKLGKIYRTLKILVETSSISTIDFSSSSSLKILAEVVAAAPTVPLHAIQSTPDQLKDFISSNDTAAHPTKFTNKTVPALAPLISIPNQPEKEEEFSIPITFVGCTSSEAVYFRNRELSKEFYSLQNALYVHFEAHKESVEEPINFDVGFVCAVNCDGRWYRAEVTVMENYPEITVVLLDKGFSRTVSAAEIRRLPDGLEQTVATVICVSFSRIQPYSGSGWASFVTSHIIDRLLGAEKITMKCRKPSQPINVKTLPVTVHLSSKDLTANLNEELASFESTGIRIGGIARRGARRTVWKSAELPEVGETFLAKVTWVNHKGEFFLQDVSSQPELDSIHKALNDEFKDSLPTDADFNCTPGDLCIAKFLYYGLQV